MAQNPLLIEEVKIGAELAQQFNEYMPVQAAFWLQVDEDEYRYLYLATAGVNEGQIDLAYREVLRLGQKLKSFYFDPYHVKVIGTNDPIAQAAIAMNAEFPNDNQGTRIGGLMLGDAYAANGFLYPTNLQAPER